MVRSNPAVLGIALLVAVMEARAQSPAAPSVSDKQRESIGKMEAAAALQKAAAQAQTTSVPEGPFFSAGWSGPSMLPTAPPDCPPMEDSESEPLVRAAATRHQLNPDLIKAVDPSGVGIPALRNIGKGCHGVDADHAGYGSVLEDEGPA
jgi:hypothetical protein